MKWQLVIVLTAKVWERPRKKGESAAMVAGVSIVYIYEEVGSGEEDGVLIGREEIKE